VADQRHDTADCPPARPSALGQRCLCPGSGARPRRWWRSRHSWPMLQSRSPLPPGSGRTRGARTPLTPARLRLSDQEAADRYLVVLQTPSAV